MRTPLSAGRRRILVGAAVAANLALATVLYLHERRREHLELRSALHAHAAVRANAVIKGVEEHVGTLATLADWYRWQKQTGMGGESGSVRALASVLQERNSDIFLLAEARRLPTPGPSADHRAGGLPESARARYRVEWVEPPGEEPLAVGSDLAAHPLAGPLVERVSRTGRMCVSPRVPCPEAGETGYDVWFLQPLLAHEYEEGIPEGGEPPGSVLVGVLDVSDMMQRALGEQEQEQEDLSWCLTEDGAPPGEEVLFDSPGSTEPGRNAPAWRSGIQLSVQRSWTLSARPGPGFVKEHVRQRSWSILLGGLSFSLLVGTLLSSLLRRTEEVESEVGKRTDRLTREIAEREVAQARLRESESRYRALAESAEELIYVADLDDTIVYVNTHAAECAGMAPEQIVGVPVAAFTPRISAEEDARTMAQVLAGRTVRSVFPVVLQGHELWLDFSLVPLRSESGEITRYMGIGRDVTELRQMEEQLRSAKEAAEAAASAKADFLATMSHEIRTPLNGIIGTVGLLLDGPLPERQRELAAIAYESANVLLSLINDILDFSKIEARRLTLEPSSFDPAQLLGEVATVFAAAAAEKRLELVVSPVFTAPRGVIGDPGRIRQVLMNLVSNAVKFTDSGHVLLGMAAEGEVDGAARLRFFVEDSGCGITEELQPRLFERFVQGDASTTRRHGGTGLGLAISRKLVELMGGRIGVQSRPGAGSTFWFQLELPSDPHAPPPPPAPADLAGLRTLVVDDLEINRRVLLELLAGGGLRAIAAGSGEEALALLREAAAEGDPFRIAVLDHQMPGMDGPGLARAVKADPALAGTLLVMASSIGQAGAAAEALREAGISLSILKPIQRAQLYELLSAAWALHLGGRDGEMAAFRAGAAATPTPGPAAMPPSGTCRLCRVLVAEDNAINQRVAVLSLESLGCRADVAANGAEAVALIQRFPYDLVFMDCEMPEMDGFEAAREIRRLEPGTGRRVRIVAMTARAGQGDRERCLDAGMDDYLCKPVSLQQIAAELARCSRLREDADEAYPPAHEEPLRAFKDAGSAPAIDPRRAAELRRVCGGRERWEHLAALFEQGVHGLLEQLRTACAAGDAEAAHAAAHRLKGSCANFGAAAMAGVCARIDELSRGAALAGTAELLGDLAREWARVQTALVEQRRLGEHEGAFGAAAPETPRREEGGGC